VGALPYDHAWDMSRQSTNNGTAAAADLVRRIRKGDAAAEAGLIERFSRGVLFFLRRHAGLPELADDLHQETFRVALERLRARSLDNPEEIGGFLIGTARNLLRNEQRRQARRHMADDAEIVERVPDPGVDPLRRLLDDEDADLVRRTIGELRHPRDRQILFRFYIAEDSKERICADLDLAPAHLRRVLFRARQRFRDQLRKSARRGPGIGISMRLVDRTQRPGEGAHGS